MIGLFAFIIPSLSGYFILKCFKDKDRPLDLMDAFLAISLGLGFSTQIVFYTLLILGRIEPMRIIEAHLLCLCILFLLSNRRSSQHSLARSFSNRQLAAIAGILIFVASLATIFALVRPWGDWDGWSYWNYHANFIFRAGYDWPRIFELGIQANHPWMLPLLIISGWSFNGSEQMVVPIVIGVFFTISTVGILIAALKKYVSFPWALMGGVFLSSIPCFIYLGTSQYADIIAANFILISCVLSLELVRSPSRDAAILTGLCLGMTASIKDNSIVASLILLILIIGRLYKPGPKVFIRPLTLTFITIGISVVLMKLAGSYQAYHQHYGAFWQGLAVYQNWSLIGEYVWHALINLNWGGIWFLALALLITLHADWKNSELGFLVQFLIIYILFYFIFFIFAASVVKLEWLLRVSFNRMLYILSPVVVFVIFYLVGQRE